MVFDQFLKALGCLATKSRQFLRPAVRPPKWPYTDEYAV